MNKVFQNINKLFLTIKKYSQILITPSKWGANLGIYAFPHPLFIMPISPPLLFYYITICYITICVPTPRIHHAHITTITFPSFSRKRFSFWNVSALPQNHTLIISREYSWMFLTKWLHKLWVQSNLKVWATASKACWSPPTILDSSKQRHKDKRQWPRK